jgi:hypothetical protein
MRLYLLDRFDLNMFKEYPVNVTIDRAYEDELCLALELHQEEGDLVNTITDEETVMQIGELCGFELLRGKEQDVKLDEGDKAYIVKKENGKLTFWEVLV